MSTTSVKMDMQKTPQTEKNPVLNSSDVKVNACHVKAPEKKEAIGVITQNTPTIQKPIQRTPPYLNRYEIAKAIGERATELDNGKLTTLTPEELWQMSDPHSSMSIANREFELKKIPALVQRQSPLGFVDECLINKMSHVED